MTEILTGLNLSPDDMADDGMAMTVTTFLQIIEELNSQNEKMATEIKYLRNEIKRLKGGEGDSDNNGPNEKSPKDLSSEKERKTRKTPKKRKSKAKKHKTHVDRTGVCQVDRK